MSLYKLVVLGGGYVDKTVLETQLCLNKFVETYDTMIDDSYHKQAQIDGSVLHAGRAGRRRTGRSRGALGPVASFTRIPKLHREIERVKESALSGNFNGFRPPPDQESLPMPPIMLVGDEYDEVTGSEIFGAPRPKAPLQHPNETWEEVASDDERSDSGPTTLQDSIGPTTDSRGENEPRIVEPKCEPLAREGPKVQRSYSYGVSKSKATAWPFPTGLKAVNLEGMPWAEVPGQFPYRAEDEVKAEWDLLQAE
ncbi:hypothetical protein BDY21DRAFT_362012 [Lineolata rhizophorae]|uniref:Uncharacterized protein n=1 Tax=Lineolata rhizophorae TaxID=578093 RepID=A0A6A6P840_9PEZI|nr:hypothetical protein BDY21DRAFT_362012 [Lineolata rhizophorae]